MHVPCDAVETFIEDIERVEVERPLGRREMALCECGIGFMGNDIERHDVRRLVERVFGQPCNINFGGRPYRERDTMHAVAPIAKNLNLAKWRAAISLEQGITMMKNTYDREH